MRTLNDIDLAPRDRAAIEEAARLLRNQYPVEQVILFGSKSRGDDDPESDIDLLVLTSRPLAGWERRSIVDSLFPIQMRRDVVLSPLIVDATEWADGKISVLPIHDEVEQQGVAT